MNRTTKYKAEFADKLVELGKEGKTIPQVAAEFGVSKHVIYRWKDDSRKPEFIEAWELYRTYSESWWIDMGVRGMMGLIPKFNVVSFIYMMKCLFRNDWLSDQKQTHEVTGDRVATMSDEELQTHIVAKMNDRMAKKAVGLRVIDGKSKQSN